MNNEIHLYLTDRIDHALEDIDFIIGSLIRMGYSSKSLYAHLSRALNEINAAYHSMRTLEMEDREDFLNGNSK